MDSGSYEIGGKRFTQTKLVWGQVKQLNNLVKDIQFSSTVVSVPGLIDMLGDKIPKVVAIVLREEGVLLKDKDLDVLTAFIEDNTDLETMVKVIEDFFDINPITYILEKLGVGLRALTGKMQAVNIAQPSTAVSALSAEETSPAETK